MIVLKLDAQQAWFLTQLFENILSEDKYNKLFYTLEENSKGKEILTFDEEFKQSILDTDDLLNKARGF